MSRFQPDRDSSVDTKRLECIQCSLRPPKFPAEIAQRHALGREVGDGEAIFLQRRQTFLDVESLWRECAQPSHERRPSGPPGAHRPRQNGDDGVARRSMSDVLKIRDFADRVKIAADEERHSSAHGGSRLQTGDRVAAASPDCQYGFGMLVVSCWLPPSMSAYHSPHLPALQPGGDRWHVDDMGRIRAGHPCFEPLLDQRRDECRARARQRHVPPAIVHEQSRAACHTAACQSSRKRPSARSAADPDGRPRARCASGRNSG